jgi:hypothetical protein
LLWSEENTVGPLAVEWQAALAACGRLGGNCLDLKVAGPASAAKVKAVEQKLGCRLPESFRRVLLAFSAKVQMRWFLRNRELRVASGELSWDLDRLPEIHKRYLSWIDSMADDDDEDNPRAAKRWRTQLGFLVVPNGDVLTIDLEESDGAAIYFDHEMGLRQRRIVLAPSFLEFVNRSTELCCVGPEIWQYRLFLKGRSGLDPNSRNAIMLRKWLVTED